MGGVACKAQGAGMGQLPRGRPRYGNWGRNRLPPSGL